MDEHIDVIVVAEANNEAVGGWFGRIVGLRLLPVADQTLLWK